MMFTDTIPAPRPGRPHTSPLRSMKVGDSYFWAGKTANEVSRRYYDLKPMRYRARTMMVNGVMGAKVWRIA